MRRHRDASARIEFIITLREDGQLTWCEMLNLLHLFQYEALGNQRKAQKVDTISGPGNCVFGAFEEPRYPLLQQLGPGRRAQAVDNIRPLDSVYFLLEQLRWHIDFPLSTEKLN